MGSPPARGRPVEGLYESLHDIAGLDPQSIRFERLFRRLTAARAFASPKGLRPRRRVKPAHDMVCSSHNPRRDLAAQALEAEQGVGAGFRDFGALHREMLAEELEMRGAFVE